MIKKLSKMPYAQAQVIVSDNGDLALISYRTTVITVENGWLACNGLYSATTRKHISAFAREYLDMDYYAIKSLVENNLKYNLNTGEVVDRF